MDWQKSADGIVGLLDRAEGLNMCYGQELYEGRGSVVGSGLSNIL